jgi:BON domain-containing protein
MQRRTPIRRTHLLAVGLLALVLCMLGSTEAVSPPSLQEQREEKTPQLHRAPSPQKLSAHSQVLLADEVRHQLVMLPNYGVFDWLEGAVLPDGKVVLRGEVVKPTTKSDAEARVKKIEGVRTVDSRIEVLPLSSNDDKLRLAVYRAVFSYDSPLFTQYAVQAVPPIHIVVKNGRVTLKGGVGRQMDGQLAYTAARSVPGIFEVTNELRVEESPSKEKPKRN